MTEIVSGAEKLVWAGVGVGVLAGVGLLAYAGYEFYEWFEDPSVTHWWDVVEQNYTNMQPFEPVVAPTYDSNDAQIDADLLQEDEVQVPGQPPQLPITEPVTNTPGFWENPSQVTWDTAYVNWEAYKQYEATLADYNNAAVNYDATLNYLNALESINKEEATDFAQIWQQDDPTSYEDYAAQIQMIANQPYNPYAADSQTYIPEANGTGQTGADDGIIYISADDGPILTPQLPSTSGTVMPSNWVNQFIAPSKRY